MCNVEEIGLQCQGSLEAISRILVVDLETPIET
jgi:hypothetical protein